MFEAYTYERLLEEVLDGAPEGIDTRPGSIFYDAVSGILIKLAKFYTDLDTVIYLTQLMTTGGEYLDLKASEYGITRLPATKAEYTFNFEGTEPDAGERFFAEERYFTLCKDGGRIYLKADEAGTAANNIYSGTAAISVNNINGLTAASFGEIENYGTDDEDDDSLRERVRGKLAGSAQNGNKQHYKTWCESVEGIGRARITPLWNGPNTVKATLITPLGRAPSAAVIAAVQEYVDPATKGYTAVVNGRTYVVGDGLGEGAANLGAHFTAAAAETVSISLSVNVEFVRTIMSTAVEDEIRSAVENYLKALTLEAEESTVVRITAIGAIISSIASVLDYNGLTLNGKADNIVIDENSVPELSEVLVNAI